MTTIGLCNWTDRGCTCTCCLVRIGRMIGYWMGSLVRGGVLLISGKFWTLLLLSNSAICLKAFFIALPFNIVGILVFSVFF